MPKRIVLTGGPGSGKSTISKYLEANYSNFILLPEAATQIYAELNTRWDLLDLEGKRDVQRRIYRRQIEQEQRVTESDHILLLDRGTIDGAAYWPGGPEDYWKDLGTTHKAELARYDNVIWLQTAAAMDIYDGSASNSCRFENPAEAIESGNRLRLLWADAKRLDTVQAFHYIQNKILSIEFLLASMGILKQSDHVVRK